MISKFKSLFLIVFVVLPLVIISTLFLLHLRTSGDVKPQSGYVFILNTESRQIRLVDEEGKALGSFTLDEEQTNLTVIKKK